MQTYEENLLKFKEQFNFSNLKSQNVKKNNRKIDGIIIIGMGGSGLVGDLLLEFLNDSLKIPVIIWKNYNLPENNFKNPLFVFVSFSGNTEETLSSFKKLIKSKCNLAAITKNGEMKKLGEKYNIPMISFKAEGLTAREALGYTYFSLIKLLKTYINIKNPNPVTSQHNHKKAEKIAKAINNKLPLIYTTNDHGHLAYIWKINFNETSKYPAFINTLPEANHNEINIFEKKYFPFIVLFLIEKNIKNGFNKKITSLQKILKKYKIPFENVFLSGKTREEKIWNSIILSHFTALELAKIKKTDPRKTKVIDELKTLSAIKS